MKRRLSALLCALTLALSLSGCWSGDVSDDSSGDFWEETPPVEADTSSTLMRPMTLRNSNYNQHLTTGSMLVEIGTAGNSLDEALRAARLFAAGFAQVVTGK